MPDRLPRRPSSIPTTKPQVTVHMMVGPVATLVVLLAVELLDAAGIEVPNPAPLFFVPVVFACLTRGLFGGSVSAAIALTYAALFYSTPGQWFSYTSTNLRILTVLFIATPSVVLMIELWRRGHERNAGSKIGNLQAQLAERGRTEVALGHLAAIVESATDAIYSKDLAGRILTWNPGAERLYGWSAKEMSGQPATRLIPNGQHGEMTAILNKIMGGGRVDNHVTERVRKDGTRVQVSLTVSPIRNAAGSIIAASAIARRIDQGDKSATT
jgi:PAS domain S-box-containing protein